MRGLVRPSCGILALSSRRRDFPFIISHFSFSVEATKRAEKLVSAKKAEELVRK
jgi:hypothetical protein